MPRIYTPHINISDNNEILLEGNGAHHLLNVLRCREGDEVILFDGISGEYHTKIARKEKKRLVLTLIEHKVIQRESPLSLHLMQSISKGDRMDFVVQKAVELGVTRITPLITQHGAVKLDADRMIKKVEHWRQIAMSACEQCGRNTIPQIDPITTWSDMLVQLREDDKPNVSEEFMLRWILHPDTDSMHQISKMAQKIVLAAKIFIGPEGGFSANEVAVARAAGYTAITVGPRILRTETAAIAAITLLQTLFGDFR